MKLRFALLTMAAFSAAIVLVAAATGATNSADPYGSAAGVPAQSSWQATQVSPASIGAPAAPMTAAATSPYVCFHTGTPSPLYSTWGTFPYNQRVYETRDWCGYLNDYQTWRVSSAQLSVLGGYCGPHDPSTQRTAGGNGYFYTTVLSAGWFDCPTTYPPFVNHFHDWQKWRCNMGGYCTFVDNGRF